MPNTVNWDIIKTLTLENTRALVQGTTAKSDLAAARWFGIAAALRIVDMALQNCDASYIHDHIFAYMSECEQEGRL